MLKCFGIKNIYVEILDCEKKESQFLKFLETKNLQHFTKTKLGINICVSLSEDCFNIFFQEVLKLKFEEIKIWNSNLTTNSPEDNLTSFDRIFYINYTTFKPEHFEIVCDKAFDSENIEQALSNILTS